ncbi:agmatine deiminase family protein [Bradyrhizobium cenepequi]
MLTIPRNAQLRSIAYGIFRFFSGAKEPDWIRKFPPKAPLDSKVAETGFWTAICDSPTAEWEPHAGCWMSWAVHDEWGKARNAVKRELTEVIQTIARYEPVRVLAPRGQAGAARSVAGVFPFPEHHGDRSAG